MTEKNLRLILTETDFNMVLIFDEMDERVAQKKRKTEQNIETKVES